MKVPWWDTEHLGCASLKMIRMIHETTGNTANIQKNVYTKSERDRQCRFRVLWWNVNTRSSSLVAGGGERGAARGTRGPPPHTPRAVSYPTSLNLRAEEGRKPFEYRTGAQWEQIVFFVTKKSAKDIFNFFFLNEGDDLYNIGKLYPIWNFYILTSKNCLKCIFSKKQKNIAVFWNFLIFGWWDRHIRVQRMKIHRKSVGCLKKLLFFWVVFFVIFSKICMFRQVF